MKLNRFKSLSLLALSLTSVASFAAPTLAHACDMEKCPHSDKGDKAKKCDCGNKECEGKHCRYSKKKGKKAEHDNAQPAPTEGDKAAAPATK